MMCALSKSLAAFCQLDLNQYGVLMPLGFIAQVDLLCAGVPHQDLRMKNICSA